MGSRRLGSVLVVLVIIVALIVLVWYIGSQKTIHTELVAACALVRGM